jgi:hypothetical protein
MNDAQQPKMPRVQLVYGEIIYWVTILACLICMIGPAISVAAPNNNVLDPYKLFNAIFAGKTAEEVWQEAGDGFPGGHFYLKHMTYGDGLTQFGLALGCSCAIWGLFATAALYASEKRWLWLVLSLWVATLVLLSMFGVVSGGH